MSSISLSIMASYCSSVKEWNTQIVISFREYTYRFLKHMPFLAIRVESFSAMYPNVFLDKIIFLNSSGILVIDGI